MEDRVGLLRSVEVFAECSDADLDELAAITSRSSVGSGEQLVRQGDTGCELFLILQGRAGVTVAGHHVAELGPGDFFGETALVGLRVFTVETLTPMEVLTVHQAEFESLITRTAPSVARRMVARLAALLNPRALNPRVAGRAPALHPHGVRS